MSKILEVAETSDIRACIALMRTLRPHLERDDDLVIDRIRRQMTQGYRLLTMVEGGVVLALAGFRFQENLLFGRTIYLDDLVVSADARRQGHAETMLNAVRDIAIASDIAVVTLDTAITNLGAQQVYERCGFERLAYHLVRRVPM